MARHGENIYKRKDGRYEGRYVIGRDARGRTRFGYVYGRQYAAVRRELLLRKAARQDNSGLSARRGETLCSHMTRWLEGEIRLRVKPSSYSTYCRCYRLHIRPHLGGLDLAKITADDVRAMAAQLYKEGFASSTVRSAVRLLSGAMEAAVDEGLIRRNPCRKLRLCAGERAEQRVLTGKEQSALLSAADQGSLTALLALYTGMRLGEICALQWQDIDWERKTVSVRRTAQRIARTGGGTLLMIGTPKSTRSRRVIPLPDFLLDMLRALPESGEFIFGGNRAAEPRTVQRRFARLCRGLSLSGVHFHTLRHTFATRLVELGVDVKTVSALLGHSSARTTLDFYAHSLMEGRRAAIDKLCGCPLSHG